MPDSNLVPLTNQAIASASSGQLLVATGAGTAPTATDTLTTAKTFITADSTIPATSIKDTNNTARSAHDLYNKTSNQSDHLQRFFSDGSSIGLPGTWQPRTYFNGVGALHTQTWVVISGAFTGSGDNLLLTYPVPSSVPFMLGVSADVVGPAVVIRDAPTTPTGYPFETMDHAGNSVFGIADNGGLWWGSTTTRDATTHWPAFDTNLYRASAGTLQTDYNFSAQGAGPHLFGSTSAQQITLQTDSIFQAPSIVASGSNPGLYSGALFVQPNGNVVCIGNNGYDYPAQLVIRQFGTNAHFVCETAGGTLAFRVDGSGKTQVGPSGAPVSSVLSSTASLNFTNVTNGGALDLAMNITGVRSGDAISVTPPSTIPDGATFDAIFDVNDWVNVRCHNNTGATLTFSGTFRVTVFQF